MLLKSMAIHLPFPSRYFCKTMPSSWQKAVYTTPILYHDTPPICIAMLVQKYSVKGSLQHPEKTSRLGNISPSYCPPDVLHPRHCKCRCAQPSDESQTQVRSVLCLSVLVNQTQDICATVSASVICLLHPRASGTWKFRNLCGKTPRTPRMDLYIYIYTYIDMCICMYPSLAILVIIWSK